MSHVFRQHTIFRTNKRTETGGTITRHFRLRGSHLEEIQMKHDPVSRRQFIVPVNRSSGGGLFDMFGLGVGSAARVDPVGPPRKKGRGARRRFKLSDIPTGLASALSGGSLSGGGVLRFV